MRLGETTQLQAAINITPLVDVVLVLLIIFMVMAPQMRKGPEVNVPNTAKPTDQGDERGRILVSIDDAGDAKLNFGEVREAMLALDQAGFRGVGLIAKKAGSEGRGDSRHGVQ